MGQALGGGAGLHLAEDRRPEPAGSLFAGLFVEEDGRTHSVIWTRSTAGSNQRSKGRSNDRSRRN